MAKNKDHKDQSPPRKGVRITNRKARRDYQITEVVECGIALTGTEVKSIRNGQMILEESFARVRGGDVFLVGATIAPYPQAAPGMQHIPTRDRKLLLHRRQIEKIEMHVRQKGKTVVPLVVYFKRGWAKCELGIAVGKKHYDKRESIKKRDQQRDISREMNRRRK